jgi:hypothetical protein
VPYVLYVVKGSSRNFPDAARDLSPKIYVPYVLYVV